MKRNNFFIYIKVDTKLMKHSENKIKDFYEFHAIKLNSLLNLTLLVRV